MKDRNLPRRKNFLPQMSERAPIRGADRKERMPAKISIRIMFVERIRQCVKVEVMVREKTHKLIIQHFL